ncbi:hypothetical protein N7523_008113 [Penicillium sp. IBT 18751x]|nr:hypothetical protein N7523_008113 [Penicillium sp. IBT 18751x]
MAEYANAAQTNPDVQIFSFAKWSDSEEKSKSLAAHRTYVLAPCETDAQTYSVASAHSPSNLIVKAWRAHCPAIIAKLLEKSKDSTDARAAERDLEVIEEGALFQHQDSTSSMDFSMEPVDFNILLTVNHMGWNEWDNLLNQFQGTIVDDTAPPGF